eukprot:INCI1763.1.p1 GENE.INCI1763.1~~INCI1763.1.p1  ORF type:complete len:987 (+),score=133.13 INCI1763.1:460-3420(+)
MSGGSSGESDDEWQQFDFAHDDERERVRPSTSPSKLRGRAGGGAEEKSRGHFSSWGSLGKGFHKHSRVAPLNFLAHVKKAATDLPATTATTDVADDTAGSRGSGWSSSSASSPPPAQERRCKTAAPAVRRHRSKNAIVPLLVAESSSPRTSSLSPSSSLSSIAPRTNHERRSGGNPPHQQTRHRLLKKSISEPEGSGVDRLVLFDAVLPVGSQSQSRGRLRAQGLLDSDDELSQSGSDNEEVRVDAVSPRDGKESATTLRADLPTNEASNALQDVHGLRVGLSPGMPDSEMNGILHRLRQSLFADWIAPLRIFGQAAACVNNDAMANTFISTSVVCQVELPQLFMPGGTRNPGSSQRIRKGPQPSGVNDVRIDDENAACMLEQHTLQFMFLQRMRNMHGRGRRRGRGRGNAHARGRLQRLTHRAGLPTGDTAGRRTQQGLAKRHVLYGFQKRLNECREQLWEWWGNTPTVPGTQTGLPASFRPRPLSAWCDRRLQFFMVCGQSNLDEAVRAVLTLGPRVLRAANDQIQGSRSALHHLFQRYTRAVVCGVCCLALYRVLASNLHGAQAEAFVFRLLRAYLPRLESFKREWGLIDSAYVASLGSRLTTDVRELVQRVMSSGIGLTPADATHSSDLDVSRIKSRGLPLLAMSSSSSAEGGAMTHTDTTRSVPGTGIPRAERHRKVAEVVLRFVAYTYEWLHGVAIIVYSGVGSDDLHACWENTKGGAQPFGGGGVGSSREASGTSANSGYLVRIPAVEGMNLIVVHTPQPSDLPRKVEDAQEYHMNRNSKTKSMKLNASSQKIASQCHVEEIDSDNTGSRESSDEDSTSLPASKRGERDYRAMAQLLEDSFQTVLSQEERDFFGTFEESDWSHDQKSSTKAPTARALQHAGHICSWMRSHWSSFEEMASKHGAFTASCCIRAAVVLHKRSCMEHVAVVPRGGDTGDDLPPRSSQVRVNGELGSATFTPDRWSSLQVIHNGAYTIYVQFS